MAKHTGLGKGLDSLISTRFTKQGAKESEKKEEKSVPSTAQKAGEKTNAKTPAKRAGEKTNAKTPAKKPAAKTTTSTKSKEGQASSEPAQTKAKTPAGTVKPGAETFLKITDITPNRNQPRKTFDKEALEELAESIKIHGIIQPLVVRKKGTGYEIIAGERRYRAAQIAELKEIPVIIKEYSESEVSEIALIENIQRENLNAIEEAQAYNELITKYGLKQEELAKRVAKSRVAIANHLRLLKLSDKVQQLVIDGKLTEGHARALLSVENKTTQEKLADIIISKSLSVRETESLVKKGPAKKKRKSSEKDENYVIYAKLEDDLKQLMSTKVSIKRETDDKGKIVIEYYSVDELERLMNIFRKGREA